ncbi:MAG: HAD-IA family hydrolase, partial [Caldilineaceae bacterium]
FCAGLARDERALAYAVALEARDGVLVGVISNTNAIHVAWLDEHVPELRTFDLVMMSNEIGLEKPDPAAYRLALELLDVRAEDAIFVDDLAENVLAAQALGLAGIIHRSWDETPELLESWLHGH